MTVCIITATSNNFQFWVVRTTTFGHNFCSYFYSIQKPISRGFQRQAVQLTFLHIRSFKAKKNNKRWYLYSNCLGWGVFPTLWYVPPKNNTFLTSPLYALATFDIYVQIFFFCTEARLNTTSTFLADHSPSTLSLGRKKNVFLQTTRIGEWAELGKPVVSYREALHQINMRL